MELKPKTERGGSQRGTKETFLFFSLFPTPSPLFYSPYFSRGLLDRLQTALLILFLFFVLLGFKYLAEVFRDNWEIKDRVEKLLEDTHAGTGGWEEVAHRFGMREEHRDSLERLQEGGRGVIDYLTMVYPELTVYDFCKYLKDITRNDIIIALSDHLISGSNKLRIATVGLNCFFFPSCYSKEPKSVTAFDLLTHSFVPD